MMEVSKNSKNKEIHTRVNTLFPSSHIDVEAILEASDNSLDKPPVLKLKEINRKSKK